MAYVSPEMKAKLAPAIKEICRKYGVKGSLSVRHRSALVLTVKSGSIDFIASFNRVCADRPRPAHLPFQPASDNISVNTHWFQEQFDGAALAFLQEVIPALKGPDYFDHSDMQSDYFHLSHYIDVNIGRWDRPYLLEKA
jgi:hypothetical protein